MSSESLSLVRLYTPILKSQVTLLKESLGLFSILALIFFISCGPVFFWVGEGVLRIAVSRTDPVGYHPVRGCGVEGRAHVMLAACPAD